MFNKLDIVKRIIKLLKDKRIPFTKFAEDLGGREKGYSKDTVYTWKTNRSTSYMNDIENIAGYLSVSPEYLLTGIMDIPNDISLEISKLSPERRAMAEKFIRFLRSEEDAPGE